MPKLDGLGTVVDFLNDLTTPKIAAQIAKKVLGLAVAPLPPDSRQLHGYLDFRRVDCGEFSALEGQAARSLQGTVIDDAWLQVSRPFVTLRLTRRGRNDRKPRASILSVVPY